MASLPGGPAIDMPAGPSELMVIADESADTRLVAADLLSQAEHDAAAQVLLVTTAEALAEGVAAELARQLSDLPRARGCARIARVMHGSSRSSDLDAAAEIANLYAPEHLSLAVADPDALLPLIRNAGAVFAGRLAAETFGDYLAGSSHVLPTDGAARAWSGVSVYTFLKAMTVQTVTPEAARRHRRPGGRAGAARRARGACAGRRRAAASRRGMTVARQAPGAPAKSWRCRRSTSPRNANCGLRRRRDQARRQRESLSAAGRGRAGGERQPLSRAAAGPAARRRWRRSTASEPENLVVTRGADDAIDMLIRAFCRPGEDAVAICPPTFSAYAHFVRLQGARLIEVPLDADFDFDADAFIEAVEGGAVAEARLHLLAQQPDRQ